MKGPALLWYTLLRLVFFAAPFVGMLLLRVNFIIAAVVAAVVGLCLSYLFLAKPRNAMSEDIYARTHRSTPVTGEDDEAEDAIVDRAEEQGRAE